MIRAHLNSLLREGRAPDDYYEAFVCLLAKCPEISRAKDYRPINLLETMHKLFLSLLTKRMEDATPHFPCQYAGRPGSQTLDALTAAYNMVDRESKWGVSSIWLSLDVSAAFDSLKLSEVGAFFMEEVGPHRAWEALRMFQFMGKGVLDFQNLQEQWSIRQTCGVQQGGSHSSWVFSCVLARRLQQLFERWRRDAPASLHSCFGILYVDDILICLPSWLHADPMCNELREVLSSMGLTINMDKTQLMATSDMLHAGKQQLSATSPLRELTWDTSATHLRWKLQHTDHSSSLIIQAQRCLHGARQQMEPFLKRLSWTTVHSVLHMMRMYVASTWVWFSPLTFPLVKHTQQVDIWQTMYLVGALKLFIPDDVQQDLAFSLLRVRRRAIRIAILQDDRWRWVSAWVRRKWTYLGHLLRRGLHHGATLSMMACARDQQVGAPWSSSYNWLLSTCKLVYHVDAAPTPSQLVVVGLTIRFWVCIPHIGTLDPLWGI